MLYFQLHLLRGWLNWELTKKEEAIELSVDPSGDRAEISNYQ